MTTDPINHRAIEDIDNLANELHKVLSRADKANPKMPFLLRSPVYAALRKLDTYRDALARTDAIEQIERDHAKRELTDAVTADNHTLWDLQDKLDVYKRKTRACIAGPRIRSKFETKGDAQS